MVVGDNTNNGERPSQGLWSAVANASRSINVARGPASTSGSVGLLWRKRPSADFPDSNYSTNAPVADPRLKTDGLSK
jgi:hypothetical protein